MEKIGIRNYPAINQFLRNAKKDLAKRTRRGWLEQGRLIGAIGRARNGSKTTDEAIARAYDEEYGKKARYGYASAILCPEGFSLITGYEARDARGLSIIDVGAGSNEFLRFCRDTLHVPIEHLHGTDVSAASRDIIASDGFHAHLGRLETLQLPQQAFDLVYLSYFIDYDTNQAGTFASAIDCAKPGGRIVLEGLFPVRPFALLGKDRNSFRFVTKGRSVNEDIELVTESFRTIGVEKKRNVRLVRIVTGRRYVQSHYGFRELPSYFLVFEVMGL